MILFLLFLLALATVFHLCVQKRVSAICCLTALLLVMVGAGSGVLTKPALAALQKTYLINQSIAWTDRNVIVLLGMNTEVVGAGQVEPGLLAYSRIAKAAEAYRDCKRSLHSCTLIVSGGDPRHHGVTEAEAYSKVLQEQGVSLQDLLLENKSNSTWQNAQFTAALLTQTGFSSLDTVVLVTSGIHMQRSMLYFAKFGVSAQPLRADYASIDLSWMPLAYNLSLTDAMLHEYFGIWRTVLYTTLGWNPPKPLAGVAEIVMRHTRQA